MKKFLRTGLMLAFLGISHQLMAMMNLSKFFDRHVGWDYNVGWLTIPDYNDAVLIHIFPPDSSPQINASGDSNFEYVGLRSIIFLLGPNFGVPEFEAITITPKGDVNAVILANNLYYWKSFWEKNKKDGNTGKPLQFTFSDKPVDKGGVIINSEYSYRCTSQEKLEKAGLIWSAKQIHPSPTLWGLKLTTAPQSELEKKLTLLKNNLAMLKLSLESLHGKLASLKNALSGKTIVPPVTPSVVEPKLVLPSASDVTFDPLQKKYSLDIKDNNGGLVAQLELEENKDQGVLTIAPDMLKKIQIKSDWYDPGTCRLERDLSKGKEGWKIINANDWYFPFYKITQKDLDDLDSTNSNKSRTDFIGKYLPGSALGFGYGFFGSAEDEQPAPPLIEIAVRAFAEVLWPAANQDRIVYITLVHGDITKQKFQNDAQAAIVNAANSVMRGGNGIDGAIHSAAGPGLLAEEKARNLYCPVGQAILTGGHKLAPLRIIHTVGPLGSDIDRKEKLTDAYTNCLKVADQNLISAIAFNCISTAIFGYNINQATPVALHAVLEYLKNTSGSKIQEVRFVVFLVKDYDVYVTELGKIADFITDPSTVPDLKLKESSGGGLGAPQPSLRFKFVRKNP